MRGGETLEYRSRTRLVGTPLREAIRVLEQAQRAMFDPFDAGAYTLTNVEFHATVTEIAGNAFLRGELPLMRLTSPVFTEAERRARAHIRSTITRLHGGDR